MKKGLLVLFFLLLTCSISREYKNNDLSAGYAGDTQECLES